MTGEYGTPDRPAEGDRPNPDSHKLPQRGNPAMRPIRGQPQPASYPTAASQRTRPTSHPTPPPTPTVASVEPAQGESARSKASASTRRPRRSFYRLRFSRSWQFWGITLMIAFSGMGVLSANALLRLPSLPNCPGIFWPTASASLRIYCAQTAAEKRTPKDLLRAISLVSALPEDHPLRPEINRNIEEWSQEILQLGEEAFQSGDLQKAIETAKKIPANTAAYSLVEPRISNWEKVWREAEAIYLKAEDALKAENLRQAFQIATQLLGIGNQYWEGTKYRELNTLIVETRLDSNKLDKAKGLADQGGLTNLLAAVKLAEEIQEKSHLYSKAQRMIADLGRDLLDLAEDTLDRQDYDEALKIVRQIPKKAGLEEEIRDFSLIAEAQAQAWGGTIADLEAAIINAQRVKRDRPLYGRAQQLISNWQLEIQDVTVLNQARQLAQPGTAGDFSAAIAEAQRIPFGNPRRTEAEKEIRTWTGQIETAEDQPYLDRAEQYANLGDVNALQAAISEASKIRPGRALYDRASRRVEDWTAQIQRLQDLPQLDQARQLANAGDLEGAVTVAQQIGAGRILHDEAQAEIRTWTERAEQLQDQPILEQARQLASQGSFGEAIAVAERINSGRGLYEEAQSEIESWRGQFQGQGQLQQATSAARMGTPAMLVAAIEMASQIPADNPARPEAERLIEQWSSQILQIAQSQASFNLPEAIAIAEQVPADTQAYAAAQQSLQSWRQGRL